MNQNHVYFDKQGNLGRLMNRRDWLLLLLIVAILFFFGWTSQQMAQPYALGEPLAISLDPINLPGYALRTILRLFIALIFSLLFSMIFGTLAAKNRRAEQIIIPAIDILQSVPVLSFLAITVLGFIRLFPGSLLGPECASIFAVFVSQVWNICFSFYQSLKTVPNDLKEMTAVYQLSPWQYFWKLDLPCAMSGLIWNMMISMSASWFFVVLSEAIVVAHQDIRLPGIGSYIAEAIEQHNVNCLLYAILTMLVVIFLYDQILFRPLIAWSERFKISQSASEQEYQSWLIDLLSFSPMMKRFERLVAEFKDRFINGRWTRFMDLKIRTWYILFNVIAGASLIPTELCLAADNFGLKAWHWWRRLALPAIFPFYITGAITAAGGAWNASIVAEAVSWGDTHLTATGLGAYIQANAVVGNFPKIALGTAVMCLYVLIFNHLIWRPLYRLAQDRYHFN